MDHRAIIAHAWRTTQINKNKFFVFGFFLAFITLTVESGWLIWQYFSFANAPNLTGKSFRIDGYIEALTNFLFQGGSLVSWAIGGVIVFALLWFILVPIFQGGLIVMIKRAYDGLEIKKRQGFSEGVLNFFKLFAFHNLISFVFNIFSVFTYITIPLKFISTEAFYFILIPGILWIITALVGNMLFVYVKFFLVLRKMSVAKAIRSSARYVLRYFSETIVVFLLLLVISLRVLLNIILVFLIPGFITWLLSYFIQALIGYQFIIMTSLVLVGLIFASWIYGNFLVFTQAVWAYTFLELEKKDRLFEEEQATT
jgi:hypothetical protein